MARPTPSGRGELEGLAIVNLKAKAAIRTAAF
jgi:hypothetical protein